MATAIVATIVFLAGIVWLLDERIEGLPGCLAVVLVAGVVAGLLFLAVVTPFPLTRWAKMAK